MGRGRRHFTAYLRFLFASFQSFTSMPGSFTKSVVHPHARHWTPKGNREPSRLTISPSLLPHAGHDLRSVGVVVLRKLPISWGACDYRDGIQARTRPSSLMRMAMVSIETLNNAASGSKGR